MYENAQYINDYFSGQQTSIRVDINGALSFVPCDPSNTDYANLMELAREGKIVIAPAEA